jgi:hypothetical protein
MIVSFVTLAAGRFPLELIELPFEINVEVTGLTQLSCKPAQALSQSEVILVCDGRTKEAERGPEAAHGDATLM